MNVIPSGYYLPAQTLVEVPGVSYRGLRVAATGSPVLVRWVSPRTRRVFYRSMNMRTIPDARK